MLVPGAVVLQNVPELAAIVVPVNFQVAAQARPKRRDAIPELAEQRGHESGILSLRQPGPDE